MKRLIVHLGVALLGFTVGGSSVWFVNSILKHNPTEPLRVTVFPERHAADPDIPFDYYVVKVENVSEKTVRGYSLGWNCNCLVYDPNVRPRAMGISYSSPVPELQLLRPAEYRNEVYPVIDGSGQTGAPMVWVDLVHFKDGTNWGPDLSHTELYVR